MTVRLKNTMTEEQAKSLPAFITGNTEKGTMQPRLFLMAPEGGAITSLAYESGEMVSNGTVEDRQFINLRLTQGIKPGETVTIAFTVRAGGEGEVDAGRRHHADYQREGHLHGHQRQGHRHVRR